MAKLPTDKAPQLLFPKSPIFPKIHFSKINFFRKVTIEVPPLLFALIALVMELTPRPGSSRMFVVIMSDRSCGPRRKSSLTPIMPRAVLSLSDRSSHLVNQTKPRLCYIAYRCTLVLNSLKHTSVNTNMYLHAAHRKSNAGTACAGDKGPFTSRHVGQGGRRRESIL